MRTKVLRAIDRSQDIAPLPKQIAPQTLPKVASSTSSKTYANDVDSNDFTSNFKPTYGMYWLVILVLDYTCFIAVHKTFYNIFVLTKIRLEY